jgi:hypothetical protein
VELRRIDRELDGRLRAVSVRIVERDECRHQDAVPGGRLHLGETLTILRGERGDEDEADDVRGSGRGVRDHRAAVRVAHREDGPRDLPEERGDIGRIVRDAAQRVRRRRHLDAGRLQALDHGAPAGSVGERAVDENNGERGAGRLL